MPELSDGEEDEENDEEQWQWMEEETQPVSCLFCDRWENVVVIYSSFIHSVLDTDHVKIGKSLSYCNSSSDVSLQSWAGCEVLLEVNNSSSHHCAAQFVFLLNTFSCLNSTMIFLINFNLFPSCFLSSFLFQLKGVYALNRPQENPRWPPKGKVA